jgi:hypothetical protein
MRKSHFSNEQNVKIVRESHAEGVSETAKKYKVSENSIYIPYGRLCVVINNGGSTSGYINSQHLRRAL